MTVETSSSSASDGDAPLIDEIAPAMLAKLKSEGFAKGALVANGLVALSLAFSLLWRKSPLIDEASPYEPYVPYLVYGIALVALLVLPFYLRKKNVWNEVTYRRQYGKWRWER